MWETMKLGDLLEVQNGYAFNSKQFSSEGEVPLIRIRDLKAGVSTQTRYTGEYQDKYIVTKGDLLIGMDGEFRCYEWKGVDALLNQRVCRLQNFKGALLKRYLLYVINNQLKEIEGVTGFTTVKHLSSTTIKKINLSLPPLAEQQRIVAKLDAAFAEIDTAIEVAEAKEAEVEKLKASLLSSSLAGNQGVAVMWKTVKLGEICDFEGGSQPPKKEFVYEPAEGYIRFLQIRDFKSEKNITYIPIAKKNRLCAEDDILIGRYGASVGQILSGLTGAYNVALMKTIPNEEVISKGWLHAYLTSTLFQHPLMKASSRSAQNGFSKDDIYDFAVPLPPLAEQQRIVAKLDAAFAEIDSAKQAIQRAKENHAALKAAILAQELTPPTESEAA